VCKKILKLAIWHKKPVVIIWGELKLVEEEAKSRRTNDAIRKMILQYLYEVHQNARSLKSARVPMKKLKQDLKSLGLKEREIVSNLDYLIQTGWVIVDSEETEFKTPKGFVKKSAKEFYKISDAGIAYFEGSSEFQKLSKSFMGINITNVQGVTVVGDQNVVNVGYVDLYRGLSLLSEAVRNCSQLSDAQKLEFVSEIETIKDQLAKQSPDRSIVKLAWEKLKPLATVSGVVTFFKQVAEAIAALLL